MLSPTVSRVTLAGRVVLLVALIGAVVLVLSAVAIVANARTAIAVEVSANRGLARDYVIAAVGSLLRDNSPQTVVTFLPGALYQPRHARITVIDRSTGLTHTPEPPSSLDEQGEEAPGWFRRLLAPPIQQLTLPIQMGPRIYGDVLITSDPFDEIDEVWEDFSTLAAIGAIAYALMLVALYMLVTRALHPLRSMADAFGRLETGDFAARIGVVREPDLAQLAGRFDQLAGALQRTMAEKDALTRKLVAVQDEERKAVARELHDEFGPCFFGLRVEARAILDEAERDGAVARADHARGILAVIEQIQSANRGLLDRLRPMAIGQLPLAQVLEDLVERLMAIGDETDWVIEIAGDLGVHDETADLSVYRIVQEAVTNALRHSEARRIEVDVRYTDAARSAILARIVDDGRGLGGTSARGLGLTGMEERARSVGGRLAVGPGPSGGTVVEAEIPVAGEVRP